MPSIQEIRLQLIQEINASTDIETLETLLDYLQELKKVCQETDEQTSDEIDISFFSGV